jgi:large subunit ribosomal protein L18
MSLKKDKKIRIHRKIRAKISGTAKRPRLAVFRSNQHVYAQLIDDQTAKILAQVNDMKMKGKGTKSAHAVEVGKLIAKEALSQKIEHVVFDRGGNMFHGRIKSVADGAREAGLKF